MSGINFQWNDSVYFYILWNLKKKFFKSIIFLLHVLQIKADMKWCPYIEMLRMTSLCFLNLSCVYSPWLRKPPQVGALRWNQWADATLRREGPEDLLEQANSRKVPTLTMCQMTLQLPKQQTTNPQKTYQLKGAGTSLLSRTVNDRGCPRGTRVFPMTRKPTNRFVVLVLGNYDPCFVFIWGSTLYYRMIL